MIFKILAKNLLLKLIIDNIYIIGTVVNIIYIFLLIIIIKKNYLIKKIIIYLFIRMKFVLMKIIYFFFTTLNQYNYRN